VSSPRALALVLLGWLSGCAGATSIDGRDASQDISPEAPSNAEGTEIADTWSWEPFPSDLPADADADQPAPASPWIEVGWDAHTTWRSVGGTRFDDLFVVGDGGRALVWNGQSFLPVDTGTTADLRGADATDGRHAAVGAGGTCLESRGAAFRTLALGTTADLWGVRLLPTGDLYAVGDQGTIRRWTGEQALAEGSNTENRLTGIWGPSPDELTVTGGAGGVLEKMGGAWFRTQVASGAVTLHDLGGVVDGAIVAVGDQGTIRRRDGLGWLEELSNDLDAHALRGVAQVSGDAAWAVGDGGTLLRFQRDAAGKGRWSKVSVDGPEFASADLADVAVEETDGQVRGVAVGADGALLVQAGQGWKDARAEPSLALAGAVKLADGSVVAAGQQGLLLRVLPERLVGLPTGLTEAFSAVQALSDGTLRLAVPGRLLRIDPAAGARTETLLDDAQAVIRAFSGTVACGELGLLLRLDDDGAPTPLASGTLRDLVAAAPGREGVVWVAGAEGTLLQVQGEAVTPLPLSITDDLHTLAVALDGTLLAAGDHGLVLELPSGAAAPTVTRLDATTFWYAAAWHPLTGWWLGGFGGAVAHRAPGGDWQRRDLPRALTVAALIPDDAGAPLALASPAAAFRWHDELP